MLLSNFFDSGYGILIIIVVLFVAYMAYVIFKNKKDREAIGNFQQSLKNGDKVVTTSGIYGTIVGFADTTDGKVVTLQISENAFIDVNIDAIYNLDSKTEVKPEEVVAEATQEPKTENDEKLELTEEAEEEPAEVNEQTKEDKAE